MFRVKYFVKLTGKWYNSFEDFQSFLIVSKLERKLNAVGIQLESEVIIPKLIEEARLNVTESLQRREDIERRKEVIRRRKSRGKVKR